MEVIADSILERGRKVINQESNAVAQLGSRLSNSFVQACDAILNCKGRVVIIGMGKSGHIGSKIAATLASTGTPAFFVHPGEASHGDLGMITASDVVVCLSYSGETQEVITLLAPLKRFGIPLIAITGNAKSKLARSADIHLDVFVEEEACALGLAPTSSTTATLVMGDALAVALLETRGFSKEDFAFSHPGGSLGRRLLLTVEDIMQTGSNIPKVAPDVSVKEALIEMTRARLGITAIVDQNQQVLGIFTDGDLRRAFEKGVDVNVRIEEIMTKNCRTIQRDSLAAEALRRMQEGKFNAFLVTDQNNCLIGALNMHDLLRAGII